MKEKSKIRDIVKFRYRNVLGEESVFLGKVMKIKPNRQFEIYLSNVIEIKNIESYLDIFENKNMFSHRQISENNILINFGDIDKKTLVQDYPEYLI